MTGDRAPSGAPFLIGITGKRDLKGQEKAARASLDAAFDIIDARLPHTPKILLSALAEGADTVAAEAALARSGWRVVAPLPFHREAYEADFTDPASLARLRSLIADSRVRVVELAPLRAARARNAQDRRLHYEQVGLYIVERSALMIGVAQPGEAASRVGGTERILRARLHGLDLTALEARDRSEVLLQQGGLADVRSGPVWKILLRAEGAPGADSPLDMVVQTPGQHGTVEGRHDKAITDSLELGLRIDEINRNAASVSGKAPPPDTVGRLLWLRQGLSAVQQRMKARVQRSVGLIAGLFALAVLALGVRSAFSQYSWSEALVAPSFLLVATAVGLYILAGAGRWQALAEDYRAISEALRVQVVLLQSGLGGRNSRVDLRYLRGKDGALGMVRNAVGQLVEGAVMEGAPTPADAESSTAAETWVDGQIAYFARRVGERRSAVDASQATSWFLFAAGLTLSAVAAALQIGPVKAGAAWMVGSDWPAAGRWGLLAAATLVAGAGFVVAQVAQREAGRAQSAGRALGAPRAFGLGAAIVAGLAAALGAFDIAAMLPPPSGAELTVAARVAEAEELLFFAAVIVTTIAGALRFVSDKLSWEAELDGYEDALAFFERAHEGLAALKATPHTAPGARGALVRELAAETLRENETWLLAHRQRPLEPVIGG